MSDFYWKFIEDAITHPDTAPLVEGEKNLDLLTYALAVVVTQDTFDGALKYMERYPVPSQVKFIKEASQRNHHVLNNISFVRWAIKNSSILDSPQNFDAERARQEAYDTYLRNLGKVFHDHMEKGGTQHDPEPTQ